MMVCQTKKGLTFGAGKQSGQHFFLVKNQNFFLRRSTTVNITLRHYQSSVSFFYIHICRKLYRHTSWKQQSSYIAMMVWQTRKGTLIVSDLQKRWVHPPPFCEDLGG